MGIEWVLPDEAQPMLAAAGTTADLRLTGWCYELKWDGMRVIAGIHDGEWRMVTRNRLDARRRFPELAGLTMASAASRAIFDGEIVCLDAQGKPAFERLQQRMQASGTAWIGRLAEQYPTRLVLFDLLSERDEWLTSRPWRVRRDRLERLVEPCGAIELSPVWDSGDELWTAVCGLNLEGVMAKRCLSPYLAGRRSMDWRKIKRAQTVEVVVGGWTEGEGQRRESVGALMIGVPTPEGLSFVGHVGTGLDQSSLMDARQRLAPFEVVAPPFVGRPHPNAPAHWVEPRFVCEVKHHGETASGSLRAPVFVRWRPDRSPSDL